MCSLFVNFLFKFVVFFMKIHLIKKESIEKFILVYPDSRLPFRNWITALKGTSWAAPNDILKTFGTADLLGRGTNRVIFNIGGNNFRMICFYHFGKSNVHLYIKWIGTHAQYDKLCKEGKQYDVNIY